MAISLKQDFRQVDLSPQDLAMLEYAEKITLNPSSIEEGDIENLRAHGFSDVEILEIATVSSYRNYIARVANALGVEMEEEHFQWDLKTRALLEEGLV